MELLQSQNGQQNSACKAHKLMCPRCTTFLGVYERSSKHVQTDRLCSSKQTLPLPTESLILKDQACLYDLQPASFGKQPLIP